MDNSNLESNFYSFLQSFGVLTISLDLVKQKEIQQKVLKVPHTRDGNKC